MNSVAQTATLVHGYTMDRVDRLAHQAVSRSWAARMLDPADARNEAWTCIVEELYSSEERPSEWLLVRAGTRGLSISAQAELHHHGRWRTRTKDNYEEGSRFNAYWVHIVGPKGDWTDRIVERMALPAALGTLTPRQYEAIAALAAHGTVTAAAEALGISDTGLKQLVRKARDKVYAVWFEHETPHNSGTRRRDYDSDVQCPFGHARAEYGERRRNGGSTYWGCRQCDRSRNKRQQTRRGAHQLIEASLEPVEEVSLTFAPASPSAAPCWCGQPFGHDWEDKFDGAPHPAMGDAS